MGRPKAADFARRGFYYIGIPYSALDCQAFVERCMRDVGIIKDLPGSNTWYRTMTWVGTPEECIRRFRSIPAGAFLFILEQDGKEPEKYRSDGIGNASHMGIKTGTGRGAIHSSQSKGGVVESSFADRTIRNGGWNRVGLWNAFDYGEKINQILGGEEPMAEIKVVWAKIGEDVFLRPSRDKKAAYVARIPVGDTVRVMAVNGDWSAVTWRGKTGWMMSEFLRDPVEDLMVTEAGKNVENQETASVASLASVNIILTLTAQQAQVLFPILDAATNQLIAQVGRG